MKEEYLVGECFDRKACNSSDEEVNMQKTVSEPLKAIN